jgi:hypothetical protein
VSDGKFIASSRNAVIECRDPVYFGEVTVNGSKSGSLLYRG